MRDKPLSIVIVGGGTAGWITASVLSRKLRSNQTHDIKITVVESPRIGIIGVGEATVPTIRTLLKFLGIKEEELIEEAKATFKHGILYRDWAHDPARGLKHSYFHPFDYSDILNFSPSHWWLAHRSDVPGTQYAEDVCSQYRVAAAGRAPRRPDMPEYEGQFGYAYHLDAEALAEFLAKRAVAQGVNRIFDEVLGASLAPDGSINVITMKKHGEIAGDFFVDCTGFSGILISKALGVGFESYAQELFCDRAVAFRVNLDESAPIRPFTTATAKGAGWIWDIDLQHRSGIGHVYSSRHITAEDAESQLRQYIGPKSDRLEARHLRMRVGRSEKFWEKNVAAIGLAGGFIEPLESTGIYLIETGAVQLADSLASVLGIAGSFDGVDHRQRAIYVGALQSVAKIYNKRMTGLYEEIRDFVKVHYYLTKRRDTLFWRENSDPSSASDNLKALLEGWKTRPPQNFDFMTRLSLFYEHNWLYVMLGMGWTPEAGHLKPFTSVDTGKHFALSVQRHASTAMSALPDHRRYFEVAKNQTALSQGKHSIG